MEEFISNFKDVLTNRYFAPNGRARRKEYWQFAAVQALIGVAFGILSVVLGMAADVLATIVSGISGLVSLALLLPGITLAIRRMHDTNKSGWMLLIAFIPLLGALALIYFMVQEGDKGDNTYGPDPKAGI